MALGEAEASRSCVFSFMCLTHAAMGLHSVGRHLSANSATCSGGCPRMPFSKKVKAHLCRRYDMGIPASRCAIGGQVSACL
jgi:hypothetical protein